jgi:hypothetical protein
MRLPMQSPPVCRELLANQGRLTGIGVAAAVATRAQMYPILSSPSGAIPIDLPFRDPCANLAGSPLLMCRSAHGTSPF